MKLLAVAILVAAALIAASVVYASSRTSDVRIERAKPTPCSQATPGHCGNGGFSGGGF